MKAELAAIGTLFLLDFIWLFWNAKRFNMLVKSVQGSPLRMNYMGAIFSYTSMILLLVGIAFPFAKGKMKTGTKWWVALTTGGFLGATTYALLHTTNMAIFKNYGGVVPVMDTVWGGVLFTVVVYVYLTVV